MNVCFESNIIDVSPDTWWLDSDATIHAMQEVISTKNPTSLEQYACIGDDTKVQVDFLRVVRLQLNCRVVYIPSIGRNLISISILDRL